MKLTFTKFIRKECYTLQKKETWISYYPPGVNESFVLGYLPSDTSVHFPGYFSMKMEQITTIPGYFSMKMEQITTMKKVKDSGDYGSWLTGQFCLHSKLIALWWCKNNVSYTCAYALQHGDVWSSGGKTPWILILRTNWRWMVSFMSCSHYLLCSPDRRLGWSQNRWQR
jgi:hypothetical protein